MGFTETTQSFTTVAQRTVSGIRDTYIRCGMNAIVRKFDPAVISPGSWSEIWVGVRWRVSSSVVYHTSSLFGSPVDPFSDYSTFELGLCTTSGSIFGQSGSNGIVGAQHSLGFLKSDNGSSGTTFWEMHSSQSFTMLTGGGFVTHRTTGSVELLMTDQLSARQIGLFMNTSYFTASYRSAFIMRFFTGSLGHQTMRVSYIYPNIGNSTAIRTDISASALADIMSAPNWATASIIASTLGYTNLDGSTTVAVSQSNHGYFDGVYLSWKRLYDNLEISDIAIRKV